MWTQIFDWAFHWILLYVAFELGKRWNEKDVAASIAAITETQARRRSDEFLETPEKLMVLISLLYIVVTRQCVDSRNGGRQGEVPSRRQ
jgi:hypothetical protein